MLEVLVLGVAAIFVIAILLAAIVVVFSWLL
jgi:hypothetical protein